MSSEENQVDEEKQVENFKQHLAEEKQEVSCPFELKKEKFGWAEIEYGLNAEGDYVWHFSTHHPRRNFPPQHDTIMRAIITFLSKTIPSDVSVDCYPSPDSWDKKVITVIARKFGHKWNFDETLMNKHFPEITEYINKEIDAFYNKGK